MKKKEIRRFPRLPMRFPRLPEGHTLETAPVIFGKENLSRIDKLQIRVANGDVPRGYGTLKKRYKKLCKYLASGMTVVDACHKAHVGVDTLYRQRRTNPVFREYLTKQVAKNMEDVVARHDRQVLRASQVIDEALDMPDPYFAASIAKDVLKGRGQWKNSSVAQVDSTIQGRVEAKVVDDSAIPKELVQTLVDGLVRIAGGGANVDERKLLTIQPTNALPPAP